ncbi:MULTISPECIES: Cof-type HAD-IIB family hydrolase [Enterococcus]|uniref:Cof-type HAD-IIB family hydrolase n=1 Tax=Enterococcus TaxID=1350 RepID=UPI00065E58D1|nr:MULTISPECIES: Cof-type HAD-IIB family hydrolase [Enterococcus]KAF1303651.1 haloacid dehalogenase [Enterococcus sp. JM9B]
MNTKLIAIDLDGTTLNGDSQITPRTQEVLAKATKAGHVVSIATGRPFRMSEGFYKQLALKTPMVNFNGALVHLPYHQWAQESETLINREIVFEILAQKQRLNLDFVAAENRDTFYIDDLNFFSPKFFASAKATENNLLQNLKTNPTSMLIQTKNEFAAEVSQKLNEQFADFVDVRTWGGPNAILEVVAKGIQKAHGVSIIANSLHIDRKDIIAFGDEHNDLEMLEYAGLGVAMANGTTDAKAAANDITEKTNDEDGLAEYLETHLAI